MDHGQVQSLVAKRVRTRVRRKGVSHILRSREHRAFGAPMNKNCTLWTLRVVRLKAFSLLRFFVALDKEMTCCHAQWLTVIKRKSDSRRPPRPKAPTRHCPRPLTQKPGTPPLPPTTNPNPPAPRPGPSYARGNTTRAGNSRSSVTRYCGPFLCERIR